MPTLCFMLHSSFGRALRLECPESTHPQHVLPLPRARAAHGQTGSWGHRLKCRRSVLCCIRASGGKPALRHSNVRIHWKYNRKYVSEKLKRGWQIAVLGKGINRAFKLGDKLARFSYRGANGDDELFVLYYTPVSKELQRNAQQLGNYMHRQKRFQPDNNEWWNIFRRKLERTSELLCRSCTGTMLGPPLMRSTKEVQTLPIRLTHSPTTCRVLPFP